MATSIVSLRSRRAREVGPSFYLWLSLLMAAVIVGGFSHTVPGDFTGTPALPLLLHLHGAVFTTWVLLFVAQPALIARGSLALHRRIGWIGVWLAAAMVCLGVTATVVSIRGDTVPSFFPPGVFLVMNLVGIAVFGALVTAGVRMRRQREWHKRLMLCATISIVGPGLGRLLPMGSFGPAAPIVLFATILSFVVVGMMADLIVRRRVHPAYYWGAGAIVFTDATIVALGFAPPTLALVSFIRTV